MSEHGPIEPPVHIGLDVGTTAVKVAAFDIGGTAGARAMAVRPCRLQQPRPGWQVVDPAALLAAVDEALAACLRQLGPAPVTTITLSTAMHGLVAFDDEVRPLTDVATWADSRAEEQVERLRADGLATMLLQRTGTPVHPMSPLAKLRWYADHEPDLVRRARWWGGIKELVVHHLTGTLAAEISNASGYGLLDLHTLDWADVALVTAGVGRDRLPEVVAPTTTYDLRPELRERWGLDPGTRVVIGAGDGPLGNLGTGAITPGTVGLSLGTSGAVRMAVPAPTADPAGRLFCYALTQDLWVVGGPVSNGGIALDWAARTFAPDVLAGGDPGQALEIAATAPIGSDGLVMVPYLLPERAPLWDAGLPGAYLGLRHRHGRQHFLRAAIEGVCLQIGSIVDLLEAVQPVRSVRATGGPFRAQLWRSVLAAVLDRPFFVASDAGGTALGAAALGAYAVGEAASLGDALTALGGHVAGSDPDEQPLAVSRRDARAYAELRRGLPALIEGYQEVAGLYAGR